MLLCQNVVNWQINKERIIILYIVEANAWMENTSMQATLWKSFRYQ